jgi:hypothetical protein
VHFESRIFDPKSVSAEACAVLARYRLDFIAGWTTLKQKQQPVRLRAVSAEACEQKEVRQEVQQQLQTQPRLEGKGQQWHLQQWMRRLRAK